MKSGILEFIEQDAELWREVERFAQLPADRMMQADYDRFHAAMVKADVAWRTRIVRKPPRKPKGPN